MNNRTSTTTFLHSRKSFAEKFGHLKFALSFIDYSEDGEFKPNVVELSSSKEIIQYLKESEINWRIIYTEDELIKNLRDSHNDVLIVQPLDIYRKAKEDAIRQSLEADAARISQKYRCPVNSLEFIDACYSELDKVSVQKSMVYEDRLCLGWSATSEYLYYEIDGICVNADKVQKIIDWISKNMPLLMGQWHYNRQIK